MAHSEDHSPRTAPVFRSGPLEVLQNLLVAVTVSFIALSLGAAFGVLSGRGAFVGMFSAGVIAFIAAALGGTRVQCSGPVAPMAAIMAVLFSTVMAEYAQDPLALGGMEPHHFLNLVCFICGGVLLLMAVLRTGFLITYVPEAVISGFMTGISLIIWIGQIEFVFGLRGKQALQGPLWINLTIIAATIILAVGTFHVLKRILPKLARVMPGTLVAIFVLTVLASALRLDVEKVSLGGSIPDWSGFLDMIKAQIPPVVTGAAFLRALPSGIEFALICYLDSLMVAMIVDRLTGEKTRKNKELAAQGAANAAVGLIGGVPGTQASIRSVMMIKEGATMRLAGMMVGVFVIIEMLALQSWIAMIPQAVFVGILTKVAWDVCDKKPLWRYVARRPDAPDTLDFCVILGTALLTVYSLTLAVCVFTALHYTVRFLQKRYGSRPPVMAERPYAEEQVEERIEEIFQEKP